MIQSFGLNRTKQWSWLVLSVIGISMIAAVTMIAVKFTPATQAAIINDSYLSDVTITSTVTTPGDSGAYTVTFTNTTAFSRDEVLYFNFYASTGCKSENFDDCEADLSNATISGVDGTINDQQPGYANVTLSADLAAGSHSIVFSSITNPVKAGALRVFIATSASNEEELLSGEFSQDNWYSTASDNVVTIGTPIVSGMVTSDGVAVGNMWVEVHNADWSVSSGADADLKGYYSVFVDYFDPGYWTGGTYYAVAYPSEGLGYTASEASFTYSGSSVSQNIELEKSVYFFSGQVTYGEQKSETVKGVAGDPVTNASVCFNPTAGGSNYCDDTDDQGNYTVALKAGSYSVWLSPLVNWDNPDEIAAIDWSYQGDNKTYKIVDPGTVTANFAVEPTKAQVTGTVTVPGSSELLSGGIGFTNETSNYWGSVIDNSFTLNVNPGTYNVFFYPDTNQHPDWGRYSYKGTATIVEGNNTYNFTVSELTATINATVQTSNGVGVSGVDVQAWQENHWAGTQTDANGQASLFIEANAWYEVSLWDEQYLLSGEPQKVNVPDGQSVDLSFTVTLPDATIAATILNSKGEVPSELKGWFGCDSKNNKSHFGTEVRNGNVELGVVVDETTGSFEGMCSLWFDDKSSGVANGQEVSVASGETAAVTFTLQELNATVNVTVKNFASGKKIDADKNISVSLWNESDHIWHDASLKNNPVSIAVIADKNYSGSIWSNSADYIPLWSKNSNSVKVASGQTGSLVLNVLKKDGTVTITAKQPNGDAVPYGWAWCGNWKEVGVEFDTLETNAVIDTGAEIKNGTANVPLVSGHTYNCGVGAPEEYVEQGWLSPPEQEMEFKSSSDQLAGLTFKFKEADASLQGSVTLATGAKTSSISGAADMDEVWCWAWTEGGNSWTKTEPGKNYRLNVDTAHDTWSAGCDAVAGDTWYTAEPYEFTASKGKNTHNFVLKEMGAWKMYDSINETFDSTVDKVITYGDGTRLTIPANTLATEGNVTVRGTPESNIVYTDDQPVMVPLDWEAFDDQDNLIETFPGGTVTIEIPYTDEALAELGVDEDSLVGQYWDDLSGSWKTPDNVSVDKENNVVTVTTDHFTQYGVTYNARVGSVTVPNQPKATVDSVTNHAVRVILRTADKSARATSFTVQIRKAGAKAKANWQTSTVRNSDKKQRLVKRIQKLKSNTRYELRVKACTAAGCSTPTDWKKFTTTE